MIPRVERCRFNVLGDNGLALIEHLKGCGLLLGNNNCLPVRIRHMNGTVKHGQFGLGALKFKPNMRGWIEIQLASTEDQLKLIRRRLAVLRFQQADVCGTADNMYRGDGGTRCVAFKARKLHHRVWRQPQRTVVFKLNFGNAHAGANLILLDDWQVGNGRLEPAPAAAVDLHCAFYLAEADYAYFGAAGICVRCVIRLREHCRCQQRKRKESDGHGKKGRSHARILFLGWRTLFVDALEQSTPKAHRGNDASTNRDELTSKVAP